MLFVGSGEGCIIGKAAELGCFQDRDALSNPGARKEQTLIYDVAVYGVAGFILEFAHHMVFAEVIFPGKGFNGQIFSKVVVDITEKLLYLGVTAIRVSVVDILLFQENTVYINHELSEKGGAKEFTAKFLVFQGSFQLI